MADHYPNVTQRQIATRSPTTSPLLRKLQEHASSSNQLFGVLSLLITGTVLLTLAGLTVIGTILGLIIFSPLIILSSPIWVPACAVLFVLTAGFLSMCGFGVVTVAVFTWLYRYFRGLNPHRFDYPWNRINDSASHVKEYGGYLRSKVIDTTPGA